MALIPLTFLLMSNNRIAAEEFISHLQFTQSSINFYRNHAEAVKLLREQGDAAAVDTSALEEPMKTETEDVSAGLKIPPPPRPSL